MIRVEFLMPWLKKRHTSPLLGFYWREPHPNWKEVDKCSGVDGMLVSNVHHYF
jgi:hypothetical protein